MKQSSYLLIITITFFTVLFVLVGCEYDVADPMWNRSYTAPSSPVITLIEPSAAPAGVNTILITGNHVNGVPNTNGVYFDVTPAEIVWKTDTTISVRRPALVADSCTVKVISDSALVVATHAFGKIDLVMERFGDFRDNIALGAAVVDSAENLYVVPGISSTAIWKVDSNGIKTAITISGASLRPPLDAKIGDNVIYLLSNNREIQQLNLTTGVISRWTQMPSGKPVTVGDFDTNGYFYTGGTAGTGVWIVPPNPPSTLTRALISLTGSDSVSQILAVRVYNGYVYAASRLGALVPIKVWKYPIISGGQTGAGELVLDLGAYSGLSSRLVKSMTFSADGVMYLITDATDPLLVFNTADDNLDYFYKNIIPSIGKNCFWGNGNYLYMISGDVTNADVSLRWNVARINMGAPGAPYY
jgi:hypothetical protein